MLIKDLFPAFIKSLEGKVRQRAGFLTINLGCHVAFPPDEIDVTIKFTECEHDLSSDESLNKQFQKVRELIITKTTEWIHNKADQPYSRVTVRIARAPSEVEIFEQVQQDTLTAVQLIYSTSTTEEQLDRFKLRDIGSQVVSLISIIRNYLFQNTDFTKLFGSRIPIYARGFSGNVFDQAAVQIFDGYDRLIAEDTKNSRQIKFLLERYAEGSHRITDTSNVFKFLTHMSATEENCLRLDLLIQLLKNKLDTLTTGLHTINQNLLPKLNFLDVKRSFIEVLLTRISTYSAEEFLYPLGAELRALQRIDKIQIENIIPTLRLFPEHISAAEQMIKVSERKKTEFQILLMSATRAKTTVQEETARNKLFSFFTSQSQALKAASLRPSELSADVPYPEKLKLIRFKGPKLCRFMDTSAGSASDVSPEVDEIEATGSLKIGALEIAVHDQGLCHQDDVYKIGTTKHLYNMITKPCFKNIGHLAIF